MTNTHEFEIRPLVSEPHAPLETSFDWQHIHSGLAESLGIRPEVFKAAVFEFKSTRRENLSAEIEQKLDDYDKAAADYLRENYSDVFYIYYAGEVIDLRARNFCIWKDVLSASQALASNPLHRQAAGLASEAYEPVNGMQVAWHDLSTLALRHVELTHEFSLEPTPL